MRPHDLPSREQLAKGRPHGHYLRYLGGCRCKRCRRANYERNLRLWENQRRFGKNDLVPVEPVRQYLTYLREEWQIGYKTVAKHLGIGKTGLGRIMWPRTGQRWRGGAKRFMRRRHAAKVLSFTPSLDVMPKGANIDPTDTVARIRRLLRWGYSGTLISRDALHNRAALQIHALNGSRPYVTAKTAIKVRDFYRQIVAMRELWTAKRGQIPAEHYVYWRSHRRGRRPAVARLSDLQLHPWSRNHAYMWLYPKELKDTMRLANRARAAYRQKRKEQNGRNEKQAV